MGLLTFVKVGEVTNLSDARYCAGMGVDLLGFNVVEGTIGYVDPEKFKEITGWIAGVSYCAELGDHYPSDRLIESFKNANIAFIESKDIHALKNIVGFEKIFRISIQDEIDLIEAGKMNTDSLTNTDYVLIHSENELLVDQLDLLATNISKSTPVIRSYGLDSDSVQTLNKRVFFGIALKGSEEIKPGYKDFDELADILEELEED